MWFFANTLSYVFTISVPDLPANVYSEATAITSVDGQGVYVQYEEKFYELDCSNECKWTVMSQTLPKAVRHGILRNFDFNWSK